MLFDIHSHMTIKSNVILPEKMRILMPWRFYV